MTARESRYLRLACEVSDAQAKAKDSDPLFVGRADSMLPYLAKEGITEKDVWTCQVSLWRQGYIRLFSNFETAALSDDGTWPHSATEFEILPKAQKWRRQQK